MKNLIHEIHRRSLWQVLSIYVVGGYVALQAVDILQATLRLPEWTPSFALVLLVIGLPIVLATAFVQEGIGPRATADLPAARPAGVESEQEAAEPAPVPSVHHRVFTWRNLIFGGVGAFLILSGFAGLYVVIQDRGRSFVPPEAVAVEADPAVAILPFSMSGSALEDVDLRESMVDLLPMALDGIEGIRPISSMTLWARWSEHVPEGTEPDLETALRVAEEAGARYAVVGSGVAIGSTVRLVADVYEVSGRASLGQVTVQGSPDSLLNLVDRFAVRTVRTIGGVSEGVLSRIDLGAVSTESPEALKEFLRGEARYRRADYVTALSHFERAVDADSSFAAAHYRAALTIGWLPLPDQGLRSQHHIEAALRHSVSERVTIAIRGQMAANLSIPITAEDLDKRLQDLLSVVQRYPDDAELWNALGELYFHNHWRGLLRDPLVEAERALTKVIALNPEAASEREHIVQLAFWRADSALARERLEEFSLLAPGSDSDRINRIMWRMIFEGPHSAAELEAAVDTLEGLGPLDIHYWYYAVHPSAWPIAEAFIRRLQVTEPDFSDCGWHGRSLGAGRWRVFLEEAAQDDPPWVTWVCLHRAGVLELPVPEDVLESVLASSRDPGRWLTALTAADRGNWTDFEAALQVRDDSASIQAAAGDSVEAESWDRGTRVLEGYREWKRGNPDRMLEILEGLPLTDRDSHVRWWLGTLYLDLDRPADAIQMFEAFWGWRKWPIAKYHMGEAYEQLGDLDKARDAYAEFVEAWKDADPELQPLVEQGHEALIRLGPLDQ